MVYWKAFDLFVTLPPAYVICCEEFPEKELRAMAHFREQEISVTRVEGVHGEVWGLTTNHPYDIDDPENRYFVVPKHIGLHLAHWHIWCRISEKRNHQFNCTLILEDDAEFLPGWKARLEAELHNLPADWDMLFLGSCNCNDKEKTNLRGHIWKVNPGPQCTHAYLVNHKAIPTLIRTQKMAWAPIDLSLIFRSFPSLNIYTILPRIAVQHQQDTAP
jgi:GR25 family glycosyltransferase involved in LPS biosynthesis